MTAVLAVVSGAAVLAGVTPAQAATHAPTPTPASIRQPASAAAKYPVPYTFAAALPAALNFDADPPGANNWSCHPSAAHPEPVVLTHGLVGNKNDNWQTFSPLLASEGYCVFALTYGVAPGAVAPLNQVGGLESMTVSAAELGSFVDRVLAATGAKKVDILGHSEGTQMPDYYLKFLGGAAKVAKYVSLAPIWHGTNVAGLATVYQLSKVLGFQPVVDGIFNPLFASGPELLTGSAFYQKLRAGGVAVPGVAYTNIVTRYDELVQPYSSGIEPGMTNIVLQDSCPLDFSEHFAIVADPNAATYVLNALDPAHPRPTGCVFVPPFVG
ncbi:MAG: alpha/beta fold hydrolase [Actinomycetota bacterium]|nr:alpha/beta fold hydrolase [Actinomycetota bacterium]MDQ2958489.1 alpha/beta fold hydrolase [Actinomycetota bacterium]